MYKRNRMASRVLMCALVLSLLFVLCAPALAASSTVYATTAINIRSGAGTNYSVVGSLNAGQSAEKLGTKGSWTKINYNGTTAYAFTKYLTTTAPAGGGTTGGTTTGDTVTVTTNGVNVRSGPNTSYSKLGQASKGQTYTRTGVSGTWTQIQYNGQTGYISSQYVSGGSASTGGSIAKYYVVYQVSLRNGPSNANSALAMLTPGMSVDYLGQTVSNWAQVQYGSVKGWVPSTALSTTSGVGNVTSTSGTVYATSTTRVYSAPSQNSNLVGYLNMGDSATRTGTLGSWTQIRYSGGSGYVLTDNVSIVGGGSSAGYITAGYWVRANSSNTPAYRLPVVSETYLEGHLDAGEAVWCQEYNGTWAKVTIRGETMYVRQNAVSQTDGGWNSGWGSWDSGWDAYSRNTALTAKSGTRVTLWSDAVAAMKLSGTSDVTIDSDTIVKYQSTASNGAYKVDYYGKEYYVDPQFVTTSK